MFAVVAAAGLAGALTLGVAAIAATPSAQVPPSLPETATGPEAINSSTDQPSPTSSPARDSVPAPAAAQVARPTPAWPPDWSQFWPTVLATFLGAGLGLGSAFYVEFRLARRAKQEGEQRSRAGQVFVLELLLDELTTNGAVLSGIVEDLEIGTVTDRSPADDVWRSLSTEVLAAIQQPKVGAAVALIYAHLAQIRKRTELYHQQSIAGGSAFSHSLEQSLPRLRILVARTVSELSDAEQGVREELARISVTR